MGYRLDEGGRVDRDRPITFTFNGRGMVGFAGDTLASALLANDVAIVGRSFKYHRPRGIVGLDEEDPGGIVDLGADPRAEPNARATLTHLRDGLTARSVNCWPSADFDVGVVRGLARPLLAAGFYYKTFMWPNWHWFEPAIRASAGLGRAPRGADPDRYEHDCRHCDVLIVGAGPAGLRVATALAGSGLDIVIVEQRSEAGGSLLARSATIDGEDGTAWAERAASVLRAHPNVTMLTNATATGHYDGGWIAVHQRLDEGDPTATPRSCLWHIRAAQVVLATGAHERPLLFANNDRPGVMLASAVAGYVNRFGVAAGRRVIFFVNNTSGYAAAFDCHDRGVAVTTIVEVRPAVEEALATTCAERKIELISGAIVTTVIGRRRVRGVEIASVNGKGGRRIACDCVAVAGGWSPVVHLSSHGAGRPRWDAERQCFLPANLPDGMVTAGAVDGRFDLPAALADADRCAAALMAGFPPAKRPVPVAAAVASVPPAPYAIRAYWGTQTDKVARSTWIDLLHDVTVNDVRLAVRENFVSAEHFKRYTTTGMAPDQGKTSNVTGMAILARETGRDISDVGTTRFRPPYTPITLGALAGPQRGVLYHPLRRLALHDWHVAHGARMEDYGGWLRPAYYQTAGVSERETVDAEVLAVRERLGLLDYSPLGKIDVVGPGAAAFLNLIYMNDVAALKPGRARYGLLLREDGTVMDDGVFCRLADDHFMLTTTSGGAAATSQWLQRWHQCEWPDLDVVIQPFTTYWGTISLSGPEARTAIGRLASDIDFAAAAFPQMSVRAGVIETVLVRVMRVSFTGEITYEISAPATKIPQLWDRLLDVGSDLGIAPFGIEALMVMRTEKGFIHVGAETDLATLPDDVGFGRLGARKEELFVGRRSLLSAKAKMPVREQLVGLEPVDGRTALTTGAQIVVGSMESRPARMQGRVTSGCWSPVLGRPIALGVIERGRERHGEEVDVFQFGERVRARLVAPAFYDAGGERMNG